MKFQLRASAKIAIVGACVLSAQIAAERNIHFHLLTELPVYCRLSGAEWGSKTSFSI
jgi:hypothetical protein